MKTFLLIFSCFFLILNVLFGQKSISYLTVEKGSPYNVVIYNNGIVKDTVVMSATDLKILAQFVNNDNAVFILQFDEFIFYNYYKLNEQNIWKLIDQFGIGDLLTISGARDIDKKYFYLEYIIEDINELYAVDKRTGIKEKINLQK